MARILLIDDEAGIRGLLSTLLERKGYDVLLAETGEKGLAVFRRERPDAVVLDVKMPDIGGLEILKQMKSIDPGKPVIIFTGMGTEDVEEQAVALGAAECVQKEFSLHRLGEALNRVLQPTRQKASIEASPI